MTLNLDDAQLNLWLIHDQDGRAAMVATSVQPDVERTVSRAMNSVPNLTTSDQVRPDISTNTGKQ